MIKYHRHNRGPGPDFAPIRVEILDIDILVWNKEMNKYKVRIRCNGRVVWVKGKYVHGTYEELHPIDYNIDMPVPYKD